MGALGQVRRVTRFPVEAPIAFWSVDSDVALQGEGQTRDISEAGAFVLSSKCPPTGAKIGFRIFLPDLPGAEHRTRLEGDGQVLRVEQVPERKGCNGFAISTQHMLMGVVHTEIDERGENGRSAPQLSRTV